MRQSQKSGRFLLKILPGPTGPDQIRIFYRALQRAWGPQNWWPAETAFEMVLGSFLTQNTTWTNVEKALKNLRAANTLDIGALRDIGLHDLERLIRPAGYFRQKSARIKAFVQFLDSRYNGSLDHMFEQPTGKLRAELRDLSGVGPETADSILLYGGNHAVFVVDAYTRRVLHRHNILGTGAEYETVRELFELALAPLTIGEPWVARKRKTGAVRPRRAAPHPPSALSMAARPLSAQVYNEMHAWIVGIGKDYCRKAEPLCERCPLVKFLEGKPPCSLLEPLVPEPL